MKSMHDEVSDLLPEYVAGSLSDEVQGRVKRHLLDCGDCRETASLLSRVSSPDVPDPGEIFWKTLPVRVGNAVRDEKRPWWSVRHLLFRPFAMAATAAAIFVVFFVLLKGREAVEYEPILRYPYTEVVVDYSDPGIYDIKRYAELVIGEEFPVTPYGMVEDSYHRELASLDPGQMEHFSEALLQEMKKGG